MKKCVAYLRLSREDEQIHDESNSIKNQRELIRRFIRNTPELKTMEQMEFSDDGYTGKSMDRPGMQELLSLVKKNKVGCIVVKDISRFSRDYLEAGKYIEQIFPFMGIRFIAINDHYDSRDYAGGIAEIDVAFKEILYDFYSVDLSEKVKSAMHSRAAKGKFMGTLAPYGYRKDPGDHNNLLVNDDTAPIVRRIFNEYNSGKTMYRIAQGLNEDNIETPSAYNKRVYGINCQKEKNIVIYWGTAQVSRILSSRTCIGSLVYHKYGTKGIGTHKTLNLGRDQWEYIDDAFEPLISRENFDKAQARIIMGKHHTKGKRQDFHPLSGLVICGLCLHHMRHEPRKSSGYACVYSYLYKAEKHARNAIKDAVLEKAVLEALNKEIEQRADLSKAEKKRQVKVQKELEDAEKELDRLRKNLEKIAAGQKEEYISYKEGRITREMLLQKKAERESSEKALEARITDQEAVVRAAEQKVEDAKKWAADSAQRQPIEKLTREVAQEFISRVTVWPGNRIEIQWKFGEE